MTIVEMVVVVHPVIHTPIAKVAAVDLLVVMV
jgi:hypothetical protein